MTSFAKDFHSNTISLDEYHRLAMRTAKPMDYQGKLEHAALGLVSDSGELASVIKAWTVYGKTLDKDHAIEECGDVLWFVAYAADAYGLTLKDVALRHVMQSHDVTSSPQHSALRLCLEAGRFALYSAFPEYDKPSVALDDLARALEHLEKIMTYLGLNFQQVASANVRKLRERYPDKYTDEAAIARADKTRWTEKPHQFNRLQDHHLCGLCGQEEVSDIHHSY